MYRIARAIRTYHSKVIEHYENPRNVGSFTNKHNIGTGLVGAPACGDVMKIQIKVNNGIIENVDRIDFAVNSDIYDEVKKRYLQSSKFLFKKMSFQLKTNGLKNSSFK